VNNGEGYLVLRNPGLRIKYAGKIKRSGRLDRMIIVRKAGRRFTYLEAI